MKLDKINIFFLLGIIILILISAKIDAQNLDEVKYVTLPGSKLWIDGTSTVNEFTCNTTSVNGYGYVENSKFDSNGIKDSVDKKDEAFVAVLVHSLDCGKDIMNEDMYNAMKSKKYPTIRYKLLSAKLASNPDSSKLWYELETKGQLFIAGKLNLVNIKMKVEKLQSGVFRLVGSKPLFMHDFGITPPSHFFGLIRAHDKLIVHFDLLAARENKPKSVASNDDLQGNK